MGQPARSRRRRTRTIRRDIERIARQRRNVARGPHDRQRLCGGSAAWQPVVRLRPGLRHELSWRSEEHTSELQSLMRISYAVFCLKKKKRHKPKTSLSCLILNTETIYTL